MQKLSELKRLENLKKNTQSLIFTPQVMRRVSTQKEFQTIKVLAPKSHMSSLLNNYELGPKALIENQTSRKALVQKVTAQHENDIFLRTLQSTLEEAKRRQGKKILTSNSTRESNIFFK
jgi:hypothetical protein